MTHPPQPPCDDEHVAPGCELFSDPTKSKVLVPSAINEKFHTHLAGLGFKVATPPQPPAASPSPPARAAALPDMNGERLRELLRPIFAKGTNDDGIDTETWFVEFNRDEFLEIRHLLSALPQPTPAPVAGDGLAALLLQWKKRADRWRPFKEAVCHVRDLEKCCTELRRYIKTHKL